MMLNDINVHACHGMLRASANALLLRITCPIGDTSSAFALQTKP